MVDGAESNTTIMNVLRRHASCREGVTALRFVRDGAVIIGELTYKELLSTSLSIARLINREGLSGERVLLVYPPSLEFVTALLGCFYAGAVAVPLYPPRPHRPFDRLSHVAEDCLSAAVLTTSRLGDLLEAGWKDHPRPRFIRTDTKVLDCLTDECGWSPAGPDDLAILQYTSGSTGRPKGVRLTHGNLIANQIMIHRAFRNEPDTQVISWLPLYHDMGLLGTLLGTLFSGACGTLMSPLDFLQRPVRWLQVISAFRGNMSGAPNFAYDLCVSRVSDAQKEDLDLSSWRVAFNGAERVRPDTLARFAEAFSACGFRREAFLPCYGLAEATLFVSGTSADRVPVTRKFDASASERGFAKVPTVKNEECAAREYSACGRVAEGLSLEIVEPERRIRCAPDEIGEIWLAGPSVSPGYWRTAASENDTFQGYIQSASDGAPEGPFLRTGDIGVVLDRELYVVGRIKELIIVEGRNHHPEDIESTLESSHQILERGCIAAFALETNGQESLCVMIEVDPKLVIGRAPAEDVFRTVRRELASKHDLRLGTIVLVPRGSLPRTTSGKIRRLACRQAVASGDLRYLASSGLSTTPATASVVASR